MGGGCIIQDSDGVRLGTNGRPEVWMMFFPATEVDILDTWHSGGLRGSDSADFEVREVFVPAHRCHPFASGRHDAADPVFRVPFSIWGVAPLAAVALGVARAAIDALTELAGKKVPAHRTNLLRERVLVQIQVAQAEALLQAARLFLYDAVRALWATVNATGQAAAGTGCARATGERACHR
jgi:alkylation response protein AidB-like acyl-CoA dehydrogenase